MVRIPDRMTAYCPNCKTHVEMKVKQEKTYRRGGGFGKAARQEKRRRRGYGNQGRYSKKPVTQTKMASKTSRKIDLRLECPQCKKKWVMNRPRAKRVEVFRVMK